MSNSLSGNDTVLFGPEPNPGDRLGNYILDRKLGSGGMGHVWKAIHEPTGKPYAIKLLPPIIASNPDAWDQVRRNFDIIENLNHPHICAVKVLDRDPKYGPYLVMAHVEGMTLNKYRQGRTFTPEQVAAILKPVAEALDFAHSRKVIHRDIKHENIMVVLADDGQTIVDTYVIDFGLAAESRTVVTQFSQQSAPLAGTLRYMAPELWRGRPPVPASDQYALAVIAYELLAGYFPIDGVDRGIMREAVLNEAVEPISGLPASVNEALVKGLAKKPEERFATSEGLIQCLSGIQTAAVDNLRSHDETTSLTIRGSHDQVVPMIDLMLENGRELRGGRLSNEGVTFPVPVGQHRVLVKTTYFAATDLIEELTEIFVTVNHLQPLTIILTCGEYGWISRMDLFPRDTTAMTFTRAGYVKANGVNV